MARKRMIKPDFWRNPDLAKVSYFDRLLFIGLWQVADDYGNGPADPVLIATELFPFDFSHDPQSVMSACTQGLEDLAAQGFIVLYRAEEKRYYSVPKFSKHQTINRPSNPQHPSPEEGTPETPTHTPLSESSLSQSGVESEPDVSTHDRLTLKEGREVEGKEHKDADHDETVELFEQWWKHYPKKVDKGQARKAFKTALSKTDIATLTAGVTRYAQSVASTEARFIKNPSTWLNAEAWDNQPAPEPERPKSAWDYGPEAYMHPEEIEYERRAAAGGH